MDMIKKAIADKKQANYAVFKATLIKYLTDNDEPVAADIATEKGQEVVITTDISPSLIQMLEKYSNHDDTMDEMMLSIKREHGINMSVCLCEWDSDPEEHNKVQIMIGFGSNSVN